MAYENRLPLLASSLTVWGWCSGWKRTPPSPLWGSAAPSSRSAPGWQTAEWHRRLSNPFACIAFDPSDYDVTHPADGTFLAVLWRNELTSASCSTSLWLWEASWVICSVSSFRRSRPSFRCFFSSARTAARSVISSASLCPESSSLISSFLCRTCFSCCTAWDITAPLMVWVKTELHLWHSQSEFQIQVLKMFQQSLKKMWHHKGA